MAAIRPYHVPSMVYKTAFCKSKIKRLLIIPTRRSETARLQSIIVDVERMEEVLIMAANTKALPRIDMSISGALRTQFMMIRVSGVELSSLSE